MFKVKIYTIGKGREYWLQEALSEYEKRLSPNMEIEWILAKNDADLAQKLPLQTPWIALDVQGELVNSRALTKKLLQTSRLHFLIGGPNGIPSELLHKSSWKWSLSPLTFTHQIVRLLLLEQLYRAIEIDAGSAYHK